MLSLQQFAQSHPLWTLEQLVETANQLLPQFLPQQESDQRVQEEVNPRLVRHYTTLGLIDKPLKEGREARYTYRHLLQLLVIRRLQMEGYSANAINQLTLSKANPELEDLLQGGVQLTVQAANPALAFLQSLQKATPGVVEMAKKATPPVDQSLTPTSATAPKSWMRFEVIPGLELHVREDFIYPSSSQEQQTLLQLIGQLLIQFIHQRRRSK